MSVKVKIFYPRLRQIASDPEVTVEGSTVGECLKDLVRKYPGAEELIFDKQGRYLRYVYVYVNAESRNKADLTQQVTQKDELILAVLVTGG